MLGLHHQFCRQVREGHQYVKDQTGSTVFPPLFPSCSSEVYFFFWGVGDWWRGEEEFHVRGKLLDLEVTARELSFQPLESLACFLPLRGFPASDETKKIFLKHGRNGLNVCVPPKCVC